MPFLNMLIKPSSDRCNLRCAYCFYHDETEHRSVPSYGWMSEETLETLVKKALLYADGVCCFSFQGGEPTLRGLDFYRKLIQLEEKYNVKGVEIRHSIQTNGTLLNDQWASFFAKYRFLVGLSLDGTQEIHDRCRFDAQNQGSFQRVMAAVRLLERYGVEFNILWVVTRYAAEHTEEIYRFFRNHHFQYIQPILCLDPFGAKPGENPHSLTNEYATIFLKKLFDLWYRDMKRGEVVVIRMFDNYIGMLAGFRPEMCSMLGQCICQFVIEADGGVYPCDFYVLDEWRLGSVQQNDFESLANNQRTKEFIAASLVKDSKCRNCTYYPLCRGGCRRNRAFLSNGALSSNVFCESYQAFFEYALPRLREITTMLTGKKTIC